jgi:hypothetical protein
MGRRPSGWFLIVNCQLLIVNEVSEVSMVNGGFKKSVSICVICGLFFLRQPVLFEKSI